MKKKIGVIVALSIMITGINYPTYSVYAQEENQDIFRVKRIVQNQIFNKRMGNRH